MSSDRTQQLGAHLRHFGSAVCCAALAAMPISMLRIDLWSVTFCGSQAPPRFTRSNLLPAGVRPPQTFSEIENHRRPLPSGRFNLLKVSNDSSHPRSHPVLVLGHPPSTLRQSLDVRGVLFTSFDRSGRLYSDSHFVTAAKKFSRESPQTVRLRWSELQLEQTLCSSMCSSAPLTSRGKLCRDSPAITWRSQKSEACFRIPDSHSPYESHYRWRNLCEV